MELHMEGTGSPGPSETVGINIGKIMLILSILVIVSLVGQ